MAISDEIPGLEVTITVNGKPLKEYEDSTLREEERTVTRYIEVVSGQEFAVKLKAKPGTPFRGDVLTNWLYLDGHETEGRFLYRSRAQQGVTVETITGKQISADTLKKFKFNAIEIAADGKQLSREAAKVEQLGSIAIEVTHQQTYGRTQPRSLPRRVHTQEVGIVSEKAIKGQNLSHSVGRYGTGTKAKAGDVIDVRSIPGVPIPAARFVFRYRSLEALKSMLIIPRTPSPPPLEDQDASKMTAAQIADLQKQFKAMKEAQESATKIKRERTDDNPRPRKVARPRAGDTQLELDDDGSVREGSTATLQAPEVIELD